MSKALDLAKFGRESAPTGLVVGDSDTQTLSAKTFSDSPIFSSGVVNGVAYLNGSKALTTSSNLVFNGTLLTVADLRDSSLTAGRITYAGTGGNLVDSASLTFDGSGVLTVGNDSVATVFNGPGDVIQYVVDSNGTGSTASHQWRYGTTEAMRLNSTGLGIGTNSPAEKLHVLDGKIAVQGDTTTPSTGHAFFYKQSAGATVSGYQVILETGSAGSRATRAVVDFNGNFALGTTTSNWSSYRGLQNGAASIANFQTGDNTFYSSNIYYGGSPADFRFITSSQTGTMYRQLTGAHTWHTTGATTGAANAIASLSQVMTLDSSGRLGIGTTSPVTAFAVSNGGAAALEINPIGGVGNGAYIQAFNRSTTQTHAMSFYAASYTFSVGTSGGTRAVDINSSGNVGIGTSSPSGRLHLYQNAGGSNILTLDTNFVNGNAYALNPFITGVSNGGFSIRDVTNGVERIVIAASSGNVGINTTSPSAQLHVRMSRTSSTSGIALLLSDNVTGAQTDGVWKSIRSGSNGDNSISEIRFVETDGTNNNTAIAFATQNTAGAITERMRIGPSGLVGIGNTFATSSLDIIGLQTNSSSTNANSASGTLRLGTAAGATSGSYGSSLVFTQQWWTGAPTAQVAVAQITGVKIAGDGQFGGGLAFWTSAGEANNVTERMRIDSAGLVSINGVHVGRIQTDILAMWRTSDLEGRNSFYPDGGTVGYSWDNGVLRMDSSIGSHNWDIGKIRLPAGSYQIVFAYRPSATQHTWNVYGTNSNAHVIKLQTDAGYGSYNTLLSVTAPQINKDLGYSITYTSGVLTIASDSTLRVGMATDPYGAGGYKYYIESAYIIRVR